MVCTEQQSVVSVPQNTSQRNKLPARFPGHIVRINKRSALQTVDGDPFQGKSSLRRLG